MTWGEIFRRLWRAVRPLPPMCRGCAVKLVCTECYTAKGMQWVTHVCPECGTVVRSGDHRVPG